MSQGPPAPSAGPVPPGAVLLHVGPQKTGSTAVQQSLHAARDVLEAHGVHYAGAAARPRRALWALGVRGQPVGLERPPERHWRALVEEVGEALRSSGGAGRVLLSNEDLGRATDEQVARVVGDLEAVAGAGALHVVAAARRYDRYLPSQWQERVKGGEPRTFADWLADVLDPVAAMAEGGEPRWAEGEPGFSYERTNVWFAHDTVALVRRWARVVDPSRLTVVVADGADPRALPDLVAGMVGVPAGAVPLAEDRSNRSLAWSETELVRGLNARLAAEGRTRAEVRPWSGRTLVPALAALPPEADAPGPRVPPLPAGAEAPLRERSTARVAGLVALADDGVRLVGDPDLLLLPDPLPPDAVDDADHPAVPPPARPEALAAAADVTARALAELP